jgi:hypothetical protein
MDIGPVLVLALLTLAATMKAATRGNPIPGCILALAAALIALYATQQDEMHSQILIAWAISAIAIVSAYVAHQVQKASGT